MKISATSLVLLQLLNVGVVINAIVPPENDDDPQCVGLNLDFSRLVDVTKNDINTAAPGGDMFQGRSYGVNSIVPVTSSETSECVLQRHRLQQTMNGIPIFGAQAIVTVEDCSPPDQTAAGGGYNNAPLSGVDGLSIMGFDGKSYSNIDEHHGGYVATKTREEAIEALAKEFGTPVDKVGTLQEVIFPSYEEGDFLSYKSEVWVSKDNDIQLYDVFISAHTLEMLQICKKTAGRAASRRRNLLRKGEEQKSDPKRDLQTASMCGSCASQADVTWSKEERPCSINSLYLNNEGRTTTCLVGTSQGQEVLGPGSVDALHYDGTYDCNSSEMMCSANAIPLDCADSISDVHYGVTETLRFYQDYLGVMGGIKVSAGDPQSIASFTHFGYRYCNAFFTTETNSLYFGDCDCEEWSPLTSIDVAAHELTHGVTQFSSGLIYAYQPGGLNEGYSDVIAATMEYYLNDTKDTPDFTLGENLIGPGLAGHILRYMEDPTKDGNSIDNVCSYGNGDNVHFTSGVLNKAFTSSVRSCQANGCAGERDCVLLMGPLFMYANIHKLTELSGYLDSASSTCAIVEEFYSARQPATTCDAAQAKQFVKEGWANAGVTITDSCAAFTTSGCLIPIIPAGAVGGLACATRVTQAMKNSFLRVFGRFFD